ncbi:MAG: glutamine--fructose-6-phosphate transaminase (isomerizing) [Clostridia bacterium]|nr:MAG: glutamine--fructose-6-phosphate transaminase (isomerizing) [Clostridia bacterium]
MCGIVGYVGCRPAAPILLEGLARLEYRGYDSAGIAVANGRASLQVVKKAGKIQVLRQQLNENCPEGTVGIGHTRWATHGEPTDNNAHPHLDCSAGLGVVHNGIIENYLELRRELGRKGHRFTSDTDTEVIPHLLEELYDADLLRAILQARRYLDGSYAMVAVSTREPGVLVATRQDSPLVIGLGQGEYWVASDIPALLPYTRQVAVLENGETAVLGRGGMQVFGPAGERKSGRSFQVNWELAAAEKGGYPHFMLKEIFEQPEALRQTMAGRLAGPRADLSAEVALTPDFLQELRQVVVVACGTAYHAGLVGGSIIQRHLRLPVRVELASEFRYSDPLIDRQTLAIAISQSGETADTLAAVELCRQRGAKVLAITNVVGSTLAREAEATLYTRAGPEIAVASTKAYLTQLLALNIFYLWLGEIRSVLSRDYMETIVKSLQSLPGQVQEILEGADQVAETAGELAGREDVYFIGRGLDYAVAMEGALKLKEISYIHAESLASGELKHGTLALISRGMPVVALATQKHILEKNLSNIKEARARGGRIIVVTPFAGPDPGPAGESLPEPAGAADVAAVADRVLRVPLAPEELMPSLAAVPLQLLAYYAAVARGCDVDQPRNLAKSVTVE